jgi:hypothetical protein
MKNGGTADSAMVEGAQSIRSASVGFTPDARYAGMNAAPNAAAATNSVVAEIVSGSLVVTPNNCDSTNRPSRKRRDDRDTVDGWRAERADSSSSSETGPMA